MEPKKTDTAPATATAEPTAIDNVLEAVSIPSYTENLARQHGTTPDHVLDVIKKTVMPDGYTAAQFDLLLMTAAHYRLNPLLGQIYALIIQGKFFVFFGKNAWNTIAQRDKNYDGREYFYLYKKGEDVIESPFPLPGELYGVGCRIFKKDRLRPAVGIALKSEYFRDTSPYKKTLHTMVEHKAFNKAAQDAFGIGEVYDEVDLDVMTAPEHYTPQPKTEIKIPKRPPPPERTLLLEKIEAKALITGVVLADYAPDLDTLDLDGLRSLDARMSTEIAGEDADPPAEDDADIKQAALASLKDYLSELWPNKDDDSKKIKADMFKRISGKPSWKAVEAMDADALVKAVDAVIEFREILFGKYADRLMDADCLLAAWDEATE